MNWTKKDWFDLMLMAVGACFGVAVYGLVIAPTLGVEFVPGNSESYMAAAVAGTICGYALRFLLRATAKKLNGLKALHEHT